ncbi:hypothetical protein C2S53_004077 [Perilla frutescens var. hirtella]|uniref:Uncharacterized protein n=1 Tax=Perilla frutescens var. hirtella TaxID=608512 RepID=A0AAD4P2U2_PERFH|nr:hypothetical protein C2S53_004077 [Perilla frutescens var. hirtella]
MWPRLITTSFSNRDKMKIQVEPCRNLNVNDEYLCAVRTKSFADFFIKVQLLVNEPSTSTPPRGHPLLSEVLLNPGQETISSLLESSSINSSKKSSDDHRLKSLLFNYFNISAEASNLCSQLLRSLTQIQANNRFIHKIIDAVDPADHESSSQELGFMISELRARDILNNPFSNLNKQDFKHIHEKHSSVLQQLKSSRKRFARKIKMIKFFNRASGVCVAAACGVAAAAAMFLAVHTLTALLMGPALFSLPVKPLKRKMRSCRFIKYGFLREVVEQLDVAAKGAYILNRDFDTIGRLVARLQDEVEHNGAMVQFCLERREDRHCLQVLKELKRYEFGLSKQAEELEEHVYLCLVTINRARAMLVREICKTCTQNLVQ